MLKCQDIRGLMPLYLDDELQGSERVDFEKHVDRCESCHTRFESERRFLEMIRQSRPLHSAPADLRSKIQSVVSAATPAPGAPHLRHRITNSVSRFNQSPRPFSSRGLNAIVAVLILVLLFAVWRMNYERKQLRTGGPSEFALMAADTHLRHIRGQLPLEITSDAPADISSWFHDKLPFSVELPNYQESSGQKKVYDLEGARLVGFKKDYAAYVAYQMQQRPISLVITSNQVAQPSGGEAIAAKGLTFHYDSINGFKVLTWSDRGLTYALVSDLEERGQQSCVVCHDGLGEQDFIEPLRPKS